MLGNPIALVESMKTMGMTDVGLTYPIGFVAWFVYLGMWAIVIYGSGPIWRDWFLRLTK